MTPMWMCDLCGVSYSTTERATRCEASCRERMEARRMADAMQAAAHAAIEERILLAWGAYERGLRDDVLVHTPSGTDEAHVISCHGIWVVVRRRDGGVNVTHGPSGKRVNGDRDEAEADSLARHLAEACPGWSGAVADATLKAALAAWESQ